MILQELNLGKAYSLYYSTKHWSAQQDTSAFTLRQGTQGCARELPFPSKPTPLPTPRSLLREADLFGVQWAPLPSEFQLVSANEESWWETGKRVRNFIPPAPSSCAPASFKGGPLYMILPCPSGSRDGNSSVLLALGSVTIIWGFPTACPHLRKQSLYSPSLNHANSKCQRFPGGMLIDTGAFPRIKQHDWKGWTTQTPIRIKEGSSNRFWSYRGF